MVAQDVAQGVAQSAAQSVAQVVARMFVQTHVTHPEYCTILVSVQHSVSAIAIEAGNIIGHQALSQVGQPIEVLVAKGGILSANMFRQKRLIVLAVDDIMVYTFLDPTLAAVVKSFA